jgi:hypothetical protein
MYISRLKVKYEKFTMEFVPRRRNVTPNADSVSLGRNCSYKVPSIHFSILREERQECRDRNGGRRDRIWTGRAKMTKESCSITEKQNGTK